MTLSTRFLTSSLLKVISLTAGLTFSAVIAAQSVPLAQAPLLTLKSAPGLVMLTMGRDLPLSRAAYNDVNDIDGDNIPDLYFKPSFKYEGYFAYDRCYSTATAGRFTPTAYGVAQPAVVINGVSTIYYKCAGSWSGNFLNWVTMSRMDVLRKVLYGGKRSTDSTTTTLLERSYVPQDSTIWGKEYTSVAVDGYSITDYTPLALPTSTTLKHMFANVTLLSGSTRYAAAVNDPKLIVYTNRSGRIADLVAQEAPILGANPSVDNTGSNGSKNDPQPSATRGTPTQYTVRVATCVAISGKYESNCTGYPAAAPTRYKPTGLLHQYGVAKTLAFGLVSGSYDNNYAGGVLRQNVDDFNQEVNAATGQFTAVNGVVYHLGAFRPWGFGANSATDYNWDGASFANLAANGQFGSWGNPLGEMMFETLKYFSGGSASTQFTNNVGVGTKSPEPSTKLDLKTPAWLNPYKTVASGRLNKSAYPSCARPMQMTIGDPKTSFDSDHLPGAAFSVGTTPSSAVSMGVNSSPTLGSLNVSNEADAIWASEFGAATSKKFFIGEAIGNADQNPSAKTVTSFKNIRGHAPDATTNQGSFYGASVARYGKFTGLVNPELSGSTLRVDQISIALDSHIPQIKIPVNGKIISLVPLSKSVGSTNNPGFLMSNAKGAYQQTGAITAFFIDQMTNTKCTGTGGTTANGNGNSGGGCVTSVNGGRLYYKFRISFSDTDQGNDNESDAKVSYEIQVNASNKLTIGMDYFNGTNGIEMHMGYVISGTTNDGVYLDVGAGDWYNGAAPTTKFGYFLDTKPGKSPGDAQLTGTGPGYTNISDRLTNTTIAAPRVFTAGSTANGEFIPHDMLWYASKYGGATYNTTTGTASSKFKADGVTPDSYYLVNNPSKLADQLGQAFQKAANLSVATASAVASNGTKVAGGALVYQAGFDSANWGGELRAFKVKADGNIEDTPTWLATANQPVPSARKLVLGRGGTNKTTVTPSSFGTLTPTEQATFKDNNIYNYLIGDRSKEKDSNVGGYLRDRTSAIGDIVNSDPVYIGKIDQGYTDTAYAAFAAASNPELVAVGSNDGMYRLVSATTGVEQLAFFPAGATPDISKLSDPAYTHQFYVDGPSAYGHVKNSGTWRSVVVSSLGAGGKSIFALNASATNLTADGVLWELQASSTGTGQYLGNVLNKPLIGMMPGASGVGAVVLGNGVNSFADRAKLLILNAATGALIRVCEPGNLTENPVGNGMSSITYVSTDTENKMDYIYAADYAGNIWRMAPIDASSTCGAIKVFTAKSATGEVQPITAELTVIKAPNNKPGYMVLFGTGKYSDAADPTNAKVQTLYGVWDDTDASVSGIVRTALVGYPISGLNTGNKTRTVAKVDDVTINGGKPWYDTSSPSKKGWFIDLSCGGNALCTGERYLDKPLVVGTSPNQIGYFLSFVPGADVCQVGGGGWVTGVNPETGAYTKAFTSIDPDSAYVGGATPRGLFIVTKEGTSGAAGSEYLYVTRNVTTGSSGSDSSPAFGDVKGGTTNGSDGSGTTSLGAGIPCTGCASSAAGARRQVWRQIQ